MRALRPLLLILALLLTPRWAAADEEADLTAEVEQISRTVIADSQMAAEATVCPTQLMSGRKGSSLLPPMYCRVGNMSVCLAKCQEGTASACYWLAQVLEYKKAPERDRHRAALPARLPIRHRLGLHQPRVSPAVA